MFKRFNYKFISMSERLKTVSLSVLFAIVVCIAGFLVYRYLPQQAQGKADYDFPHLATAVIGTRTATSTTGVGFSVTGTGGQSATSTYISRIGGNKSNAVYTFVPTAVSSTASFAVDIQGSNDDFCDATATSTTDVACVGDCILATDINWFNAGDHLKGKVHSTSFSNASSTAYFSWTNPKVDAGNEIILTDLNYECLRLGVSGSSTVMFANIRTK